MISFFKRLNQLVSPPIKDGSAFNLFWRAAFFGLATLSLGVMVLSGLFFRTGLPLWLMATATLIIGVVSFWLLRILGILGFEGTGICLFPILWSNWHHNNRSIHSLWFPYRSVLYRSCNRNRLFYIFIRIIRSAL